MNTLQKLVGCLFSLFLSPLAAAETAKVNGINMYYELHGKSNAEPIILIAGFSCDHTFWAGMLKQLSAKHQVLVFDNRGIGQTSSPDQPYTIDMMADDVMALSHQLGLKNPVVVGQSMGSAIAQSIGKRFAADINKIVLINTFDRLTKLPEVAFTLTGDLQRLNVAIAYRVRSIAAWVYSDQFLSQPDQLQNLIKFAEDNPYQQTLVGYERQLGALKKFDSRAWLGQIKAPTLIIAGEEDILAPRAGAQEVQKSIGQHAQLVMIPGGHASPIEQPDLVVKLILDFVD